MKHGSTFDADQHDPRDPSPWLALYLDQSTPLGDEVKKAWLVDSSSWSRQFILPLVRPLARLTIILIQLAKVLLPNAFTSSWILHRVLAWGLEWFVRPEANWLILRHFHLGSNVLSFIAANAGAHVETSPLRPLRIKDLRDDMFLQHDLNLYNFVIRLSSKLRERGEPLRFVPNPDYSMIEEPPLRIEDMPNRFTNFIDLQTAIELFTPAYQLFLTDNDFWRAANSLQLDETIALYTANIVGAHEQLVLLNNKHPLIPESTLATGFRLTLHGMSTEMLHALLLQQRGLPDQQQQQA